MPLTSKGEKIRKNMREEYGAEGGNRVFYASRNAGKITGVDSSNAPGMGEVLGESEQGVVENKEAGADAPSQFSSMLKAVGDSIEKFGTRLDSMGGRRDAARRDAKSHGWKKTGSGISPRGHGAMEHHEHADHPGHKLTTTANGNWSHSGEGRETVGQSPHSLQKHLTQFHRGSGQRKTLAEHHREATAAGNHQEAAAIRAGLYGPWGENGERSPSSFNASRGVYEQRTLEDLKKRK